LSAPAPRSADAPLLEARDLECVRDERILFTGLSFSVTPGEVVQIEGDNGSGKTSLLRILSGLALAESGEVLWQGAPLHRVRSDYFANLAWLGHAHGVKLELNPLENLRVARALKRPRGDVDLEEALAAVGLAGFEDVPARMLSAGQCRRVALARLLVTRAQVWILDEPFTAIDRRGVRDIEDLVTRHTAAGGVALLTTHQMARLERCKVVSIRLGAR
jgi:heme exporter protein A